MTHWATKTHAALDRRQQIGEPVPRRGGGSGRLAGARLALGTVGYRVWIARCGPWQPGGPLEVPAALALVEPSEPDVLPAAEAKRYVAAFNRAILAAGRTTPWAVALPVALGCDGEGSPGTALRRAHLPQNGNDAPPVGRPSEAVPISV